MTERANIRILFAGGGTGGHFFPAAAVAEETRAARSDAKILFVGAKNKIEAEAAPKLGFEFKPIWVAGFARRFSLKNVLFPVKLLVSLAQSLWIATRFKPNAAVGSGGYASGPAIWAARVMGARVILLEQNSYPGVTTRLLEKRADAVCLGLEDAKKFLRFPKKHKLLGNPVRSSLANVDADKARRAFGLDPAKPTLLVLGGSLGAAAINEAIAEAAERLTDAGAQVLWQTGKRFYDRHKNLERADVKVVPFIEDMGAAYGAADLVLARAGATTIAELLALGKPSILAPSPHVAANHQYHNAKSLENAGAAITTTDETLKDEIVGTVGSILNDSEKLDELRANAKALGKPNAAKEIAELVLDYAEGS
jgi:UDP-N-acetylglucosamine--N-acetylmuramyl-(pentapeptide) pyrophosphoryl-undecaprenol N-acetylglucosamine transferase